MVLRLDAAFALGGRNFVANILRSDFLGLYARSLSTKPLAVWISRSLCALSETVKRK